MSRRAWCVAFMVTAWLGAAGVASAGTVEVRPSGTEVPGDFLSFQAAQGERNDVVVSIRADGGFDITDRGAPLEAKSGCTQVDANRATCAVPNLASGSLGLWDEDDSYTGPDALSAARPHVYLQVDTGEGDDVVSGGVANELISNREGDDQVTGGAGQDSYWDLSGPETGVTITLDGVANDGPPGGRSNVAADIENLSGGRGPDVLAGGAGPNSLSGSEGDDVLIGGDGDDYITAGPGNDRVDAGGGRDQIHATEGWLSGDWADQIACGEGDDWGWGDDADVIAPDCDVFFTPSRSSWSREYAPRMPDVRATAYVRRRTLFVRLRCPAGTVECAGAVAVHAKRIRLARKTFMLAPGRALRLRMPLTRRGQRLLRHRSRVRAVARFTSRGSEPVARTARLVVRRAR